MRQWNYRITARVKGARGRGEGVNDPSKRTSERSEASPGEGGDNRGGTASLNFGKSNESKERMC